MIDLNDASNDEERLALSIFQAMDRGTLMEELRELCTEDFVWANSGLPTLAGLDAVFDLMSRGGFRNEIPILETQTHFSADLLHIASTGNVVFTERIDHHWDADGRDLMTPHICGIIEIRGSQIARLHDFYDTICYQQTPTEIQPEYTLAAHRERQQRD